MLTHLLPTFLQAQFGLDFIYSFVYYLFGIKDCVLQNKTT